MKFHGFCVTTRIQAETDLKSAEEKFEHQVEITKLLMEGISSAQANHVRCLSEFVDAQISFYTKCYEQMIELQRELALLPTNSGDRSASSMPANYSVGTNAAASVMAFNNNVISSKNANLQQIKSASQNHAAASNQSGKSQATTLDNGIFKAAIVTSPTDDSVPFVLPDNKRRARVLYDFEAQSNHQLSVQANEVVVITLQGSQDADFWVAERGSQRGQVPVAYLEILN